MPRISIVNELKGWQVPERAWRALLQNHLEAIGAPGASLSLLVCGSARIRALNRRFRGVDKATDVLSFPALEGRMPRGFEGHLGDLALCWPYVARAFPRFEDTLERETALLLLHGCLHLSGRHHDTPAQEEALWRTQRRLMRGLSATLCRHSLPHRKPC